MSALGVRFILVHGSNDLILQTLHSIDHHSFVLKYNPTPQTTTWARGAHGVAVNERWNQSTTYMCDDKNLI